MLAEYPSMIDAHAAAQSRLVAAWFRRKRLEARLIANEVGRLLGGTENANDYQQIDEDAALAALGIVPKHIQAGKGEMNATTG